jgi:hypothetical protein
MLRQFSSSLAIFLALSAATVVQASDWGLPLPFAVGNERTHYDRGDAVVFLDGKRGAVSIRASTIDHGNLVFEIVAYNYGDAPADFDLTNISASAGTETVTPVTLDELVKASKDRAMWSNIGTAALAGLAAAAASQAYTTHTSHGSFYTPHGAYHWRATYRDNTLGDVAAGAAVGVGVGAIRNTEARLNDTLASLRDGVIQRTTVAPGDAYGGQVVLRKFKASNAERNINFLINWNGEEYRFGFRRMKPGEPEPQAPTSAQQPNATPLIVPAQPLPVVVRQ